MKKLIAVISALVILMSFAACKDVAPSSVSPSTTSSTTSGVIEVGDNTTTRSSIKLGIVGLGAESRAAGDWMGKLTISGVGIDGDYVTYISRANQDDGGYLTILLPHGEKTFSVELIYDTGTADLQYTGSETATIAEGLTAVNITVVRANEGGADITVGIKEKISLNMKEAGTSFAASSAIVEFLNGSTVVTSVTLGTDGQGIAEVPVQGTSDDAYTYKVYRGTDYVILTGTVKVLMGKIVLDGTEQSVMEINKFLTPDTQVPTGSVSIVYQNNGQPAVQIFTITPIRFIINVSDDNEVINVNPSVGTAVKTGPTTWAVDIVPGTPGNFTFSAVLTDSSGKTGNVSTSYTVVVFTL